MGIHPKISKSPSVLFHFLEISIRSKSSWFDKKTLVRMDWIECVPLLCQQWIWKLAKCQSVRGKCPRIICISCRAKNSMRGEFCFARSRLVFSSRCIKSFSVSPMTYTSPVWIKSNLLILHENSRAMSTHASFERCWWHLGPPICIHLLGNIIVSTICCCILLMFKLTNYSFWCCDFPRSSWFYCFFLFWDK